MKKIRIKQVGGIIIMLLLLPLAARSSDTDGDNMPDDWEIYSGILNPSQNDAQQDYDGDGLTNLYEYQHGIHPGFRDSDGDGVDDNIEISQYNTDPALADTDNGGVSDGDEIARGSSPLNPDDDMLQQSKISISLNEGWNLISVPIHLASPKVEEALASIDGKYLIVRAYQNQEWKMNDPTCEICDKTLTELTPGWGYWIKMEEAATLILTGISAGKSLPLIEGWNLVGYNSMTSQSVASAVASISGQYTIVWGYENGTWKMYDAVDAIFNNLELLRPGYGYWIKTTTACNWTLP